MSTNFAQATNSTQDASDERRMNIFVPDEVQRRMKAAAALKGRSLSDVSVEAFRSYLTAVEKEQRPESREEA